MAASAPTRLGRDSRSPAAITRSPATMSAPRLPMFCPAAAAAKISIVPASAFAVSSTITTASAPAGSGAPVAISAQVPRVTTVRRYGSGVDAIEQAQARRGRSREAPLGVGRDDRVAVHRRSRERRHVDRRRDVGGGHTSRRVLEAHALGARDRTHVGVEPAPRFVEGDGRREWSHRSAKVRARDRRSERRDRERDGFSRASVHFDACCTRCPSSGNQQPFHGQPHRRFRTRQRDDDLARRRARRRRGSSSPPIRSPVAQHPEQLAEAVEPLLQQRRSPPRRCCRAT